MEARNGCIKSSMVSSRKRERVIPNPQWRVPRTERVIPNSDESTLLNFGVTSVVLEKNITNITKLRNCIDEFQEENAIEDVEIT